MNNTYEKQQGFTLVELAIVLVIIGLIIGGILVGQDMIRSAEVRSTIGQYEKYNTALNVFRDKYGALPGDLANAENFGFNDRTSGTGGATTGDGNGLLEDCAATSGMLLGCETAAFWEDLSIANLLEESAVMGTDLDDVNHANGVATTALLPEADLGNGIVWQVYSTSGRNYYHLASRSDATAGPAVADSVTPIDAYNIDNKVDDGTPAGGTVNAVSARGTVDTDTTGGASGECLDLIGGVTIYNTDEGNGGGGASGDQDVSSCQLMFRVN